MVDNDPVRAEGSLARRNLLRGGAVLSGAAVVGAALAPPAEAADGDGLVLGQSNDAESQTGLTIGAAEGSASAALALTNADGPSLSLNPLDDAWDGSLQPGQIANTGRGPLIGISQDGNQLTTPLLTEQDVWLPFVLATPMRLIDTRTVEGRFRVTRPSPLGADGRLSARTAMTFWIAPAGGQGDNGANFSIPAIHLNITVVRPAEAGHVTVYPGPDRPNTSTVNFTKGTTLANSALIGTSVGTYSIVVDPSQPSQELQAHVVKVYTTATAWIVVDATAAYATGWIPPTEAAAARARTGGLRKDSPRALAQRSLGRF